MLPDFIVIGAPRSGTTWLYEQLSHHPQVYLPENKEPRFFAIEAGEVPTFTGPGDDVWSSGIVAERERYEELLADAGACCKGEASTDYLYRGPVAAKAMRELVPSVRIVAILRNQAVRAHSAWRLLVHSGFEPLSFEDALRAEEERISQGWAWWWHYTQHGFYARNLAPYFDTFPRDQILLLPYDDVAHRPQAVLDTVTDFIGVSRMAGHDVHGRVNAAPLTRSLRRSIRDSPRLASVARRIVPATALRGARSLIDRFTLYTPPVEAEPGSSLTDLYRSDHELLQEMAGRTFDLAL
jgi:hypothetical protein